MTARGLEQDFTDLYISQSGDSQRPPSGYHSHQRLGPSPFKNGYGPVNYKHGHAPSLPEYPRPSHPAYTKPHHTPSGQYSHYRIAPHPGNRGYHGNPNHGVTQQHGHHPHIPAHTRTSSGLPSFKPVIYKNPAEDEESEEEEDEEPSFTGRGGARVSQTHGYYGHQAPNTYYTSSEPVSQQTSHSQQVRLHRIPVQHISTSRQAMEAGDKRYNPVQHVASSTRHMPNTSQSGAVYSGIATSAPIEKNMPPPPAPHKLEENDYVNTSALTSSNYYNDEEGDEFIPPAVPTQLSYGSVAAQPHTPRIKGPDYRIAPDVLPDHRPPYLNPTISPSPSFQGHHPHSLPEPVSSKILYTAPVAPAGRGFVQSHHKDSSLPPGGMPPPPTYDHPAYSKQRDGPMSYAASYPPPQQSNSRSGLYDYSDHHQVGVAGDVPIGGEKKQEEEVDALTQMLMQNMEAAADPDFFGLCAGCGCGVRGVYNACLALGQVYHISCFSCYSCGMCARCGRSIMGENTGCSALDQLYHIDCFTCIACGQCLGGQPFFAMEGKPYCEPCYMNTLEKCSVCSKPITDRILRATGKPYHPGCFTCVVCGKSLDGVPFTVDATNQIHCIEDFHKKFAPRCCVCYEAIMPEAGNEETVRIVAMDKSFHVKCYKCVDCGMVLSSEAEGRGCYPLDDDILCKNCNASRIQALTTKMTTEL